MKLFGYTISKTNEEEKTHSVVRDDDVDAHEWPTNYASFGQGEGQYSFSTENQLITKYRYLANQSEVDKAIDNVINSAFSYDENTFPVEINLENTDLGEKTKKIIKDEFRHILGLMNFQAESYDLFRRWYVDGRIYLEKSIDKENPKDGIKRIKYIDPRKIKRMQIEDIKKSENIDLQGVNIRKQKFKEYYIYNPDGMSDNATQGVALSPDSIVYVNSGIYDENNRNVLSYLHKAIKPFNNLRLLEDSLVIYRIVRAPERRIFNLEIGNLQKSRAEQYIQDHINRFTRDVKYDPVSGEMADSKKYMTMTQDYWFAKRDGKGTTVDPLAGGQNLGELEDVTYFKNKLYESLNVPISRLDAGQSQFNIGRTSEITRDELQFSKYVSRLRKRFSSIFFNIMQDQLLMKGILTYSEWLSIKNFIVFDYREDTFFTELKWSEIIRERISTLDQAATHVGVYFSKKWMRENILQLSEEEISTIKEEIEEEKKEEPDENPENF